MKPTFLITEEDLKVSKCLQMVGCILKGTRDIEGKETFIVFEINTHITGHFLKWYFKAHHKMGTLKVLSSLL